MIHQKLIQEFIQKHTKNWFEEDLPQLKEKISLGLPKMLTDLADSISQVCQQASQLQAEGHKGPAAYLCISYLYTNILENIWEYRLDLYDEGLYFDRKECTAVWKPELIWDCFAKRLAEVHAAAHTGFYRNKIRPFHLTEIKIGMAEQYHMATIMLAQQIIEYAIQTPAYQKLTKTPDFQIIIGEYQDQGLVIHQEQGGDFGNRIGGE